MNDSKLTALMHAVLDGEATSTEAGELEQRLAGNAAAQARFDELRHLFEDLKRVPKAFPPEGLVASVLANIPQNRTSLAASDQLFVSPGVLEASSKDARITSRGRNKGVRQFFQPWAFSRETDMNGKPGLPGNRKVWIGGGIAAAAVVVAVSAGLFPPNAGDTAGTIVPAQRYQAVQSAAKDVGGGGTAGTTIPQVPSSANQAGDNTANAAGLNSGDRGGLNSGDRGGLNSGDRGGLNSGDRGGLNSGDRGGLNSGDRGGLNSGDRGGLNSGDRGGLNSGDRGGLNSGDRGGLNSGDRGGLNSGDRGGLNSGDRGGLNSGDRGGLNSGDRGGLNSGDRASMDR